MARIKRTVRRKVRIVEVGVCSRCRRFMKRKKTKGHKKRK